MPAGFTKAERSSFKYWFAHWCAYQLTALNLHQWKVKYLLHDIEKPWLKLFLPYEKVQKIHRRNNAHHLAYKDIYKIDWLALVIDWECSRLTKIQAPMNARETYEKYITQTDVYSLELIELMKLNIPPILEKLGL